MKALHKAVIELAKKQVYSVSWHYLHNQTEKQQASNKMLLLI